MADLPDAFDALRRPIRPLAPRSDFAASLRRRLEQELGMTLTDDGLTPRTERDGTLALLHLRVGDADRAMAFFERLFGWEAERVPFEGHISHYTLNTAVTVRILDDPSAAPIVPNYRVSRLDHTVRAIKAAGGRVTKSEATPDGGGWAWAVDDQGIPLLVFRPSDRYHAQPTRTATGDVGLIFIRANASRAERFYASVLGWRLERSHPDSQYFHAVPRVGIFDESAAFGREVNSSATLYLAVDNLSLALARVEELGGHAGPAAQDMGPYFTAMCTDDQGTEFGLMAETLEGAP
jgi:predicted enzyme related to lactoylglutathione lyase